MSSTTLTDYGPWALVTGASGGIGRQFTEQLAAAGLNIVLVARNQDRLDTMAAIIRERYGVKTRTIAADLSAPDVTQRIVDEANGLDIGLIVSNAGGPGPGTFVDTDIDGHLRAIDFNYRNPVQLSHAFLPRLRGRTKAGIILVSSVIAAAPAPQLGVYGPSKSALRQFGHVLADEVEKDGVDVLVLSPGGTRTEFADEAANQKMLKRMDAPEDVVKATLKGLGRKRDVFPGTMAPFMQWLVGRVLTARAGAALYKKFTATMLGDAHRINEIAELRGMTETKA